MNIYASAESLVRNLYPQQSVYCLRPRAVARLAQWFLGQFPGHVVYSVKSNPDPLILKTLHENGVRNFDVASIAEVEQAAAMFPDAKLYFMHTVKNRDAIRRAYFEFGVRDFSLDSHAELEKILDATGNARDLGLHVRIAVPNEHSQLDLSGKFGIGAKDAPELLQRTRRAAARLGICFHVGSQCMHPTAYAAAIARARALMKKANAAVDVLDVGGGFPSVYPGMTPPPLANYMREIKKAVKTLPGAERIELWCEPGRSLVAESGSLVVKVELRKDRMLYINDGIYGSLFDAGMINFPFPARLVRPDGPSTEALVPFGFYGPTCDSLDKMAGPFLLPEDVREGDYIEIGQLGAYGRTMQTNFNGFASHLQAMLEDGPMLSIFDVPARTRAAAETSA